MRGLLCLLLFVGVVGCSAKRESNFVRDSVRAVDLPKLKYRMVKPGAMGEDIGFKLVWIPFVSPSDGAAKLDMIERMRKEGIETAGKNIAFTNATSNRSGTGLFGFVGWPTITLVADVIEILE